MHPPIGDQAHQVHRARGGRCGLGRRHERGVGKETAVGDGVIDQDQVLADGAAGAEGHVADLGVAHLPVRQPYCTTGCLQHRVRVHREIVVETRGVGNGDRVMGLARVGAEAIEDDENDGPPRGLGHIWHG